MMDIQRNSYNLLANAVVTTKRQYFCVNNKLALVAFVMLTKSLLFPCARQILSTAANWNNKSNGNSAKIAECI